MTLSAFETKFRLIFVVMMFTLGFCAVVGIAILNGDRSWLTLGWKRAVLGVVSVIQILALLWCRNLFQNRAIKESSRLKGNLDNLEKGLAEISRQLVLAMQNGDNERADVLSETSVVWRSRRDQILKELEREAGHQSRETILVIFSRLIMALHGLTGIPRLLDFVGYLFPRSFRQYEWRLSVTDYKLDYKEARQKFQSRLMRTCLVLLFGYKGVKLFLSAQGVLWWSRMTKALESLVQVFRK